MDVFIIKKRTVYLLHIQGERLPGSTWLMQPPCFPCQACLCRLIKGRVKRFNKRQASLVLSHPAAGCPEKPARKWLSGFVCLIDVSMRNNRQPKSSRVVVICTPWNQCSPWKLRKKTLTMVGKCSPPLVFFEPPLDRVWVLELSLKYF